MKELNLKKQTVSVMFSDNTKVDISNTDIIMRRIDNEGYNGVYVLVEQKGESDIKIPFNSLFGI